MRESCFRGKRIHHGEWVEGYYFAKPILEKHFIQLGEGQWMVDSVTVGEFSGKRDKNGRRIFEGDIVDGLFRFGMPLRAVCAFKDGAFGLAWTHGGVDHFSAFTSICNVEYEVVGNIYDNHEMLEQEVQ